MWKMYLDLNLKRNAILLSLVTSITACSGILGKKDSSNDGGGTAPAPVATPTPVVATPTPLPSPTPGACQNAQQSIGANIVFLIDNSNSLSATDCPSPTQSGVIDGVATFQCGGATSREKAVLEAFDSLVSIAAKDSRDLAISSIAVVQFPTPENRADGSRVMTNGWIRTNPAQNERAALSTALQFTRTPVGATPYGASISAAHRLYSVMQNDGRARVAILVTDGEPTDRDPAATNAQAVLLRQQGVQVFTIYVTSGQNRTQRVTSNQQMLTSWEQAATQQGKHWYASHYNNFNEYFMSLAGSTNQASLAQSVTSPVNAACVDAPGAICQRYMVEVSSADAIASVVQQIIRTKTTACQ